jgi:hypothetical protein
MIASRPVSSALTRKSCLDSSRVSPWASGLYRSGSGRRRLFGLLVINQTRGLITVRHSVTLATDQALAASYRSSAPSIASSSRSRTRLIVRSSVTLSLTKMPRSSCPRLSGRASRASTAARHCGLRSAFRSTAVPRAYDHPGQVLLPPGLPGQLHRRVVQPRPDDADDHGQRGYYVILLTED